MKVTIEIYDTPQGPQWLAYPDTPWKGGRPFTAAEKLSHQLIMNLEAAAPITVVKEPEKPPEEDSLPLITNKEDNVIHADFSRNRKTAAQKWKEKLKCSTPSTTSSD